MVNANEIHIFINPSAIVVLFQDMEGARKSMNKEKKVLRHFTISIFVCKTSETPVRFRYFLWGMSVHLTCLKSEKNLTKVSCDVHLREGTSALLLLQV